MGLPCANKRQHAIRERGVAQVAEAGGGLRQGRAVHKGMLRAAQNNQCHAQVFAFCLTLLSARGEVVRPAAAQPVQCGMQCVGTQAGSSECRSASAAGKQERSGRQQPQNQCKGGRTQVVVCRCNVNQAGGRNWWGGGGGRCVRCAEQCSVGKSINQAGAPPAWGVCSV